METSTILVILLSILEVSLVFTFRKKRFDFGEFLSCLIPAVLQVGFLYFIFFEDQSTTIGGRTITQISPWIILAITGGSLLLYLLFANKADYPKTTKGWMWFVTASLMVTSIVAVIIETFLDALKDTDNNDRDRHGWVPPSG